MQPALSTANLVRTTAYGTTSVSPADGRSGIGAELPVSSRSQLVGGCPFSDLSSPAGDQRSRKSRCRTVEKHPGHFLRRQLGRGKAAVELALQGDVEARILSARAVGKWPDILGNPGNIGYKEIQ